MKKVLWFFMLASLAFISKASAQQQVAFSVQAHEDDWQLFWVQSMMNELKAGTKVVFITLTAGDGGNGAGNYCSPIPFYLGREKGSVISAKYTIDVNNGNPIPKPDSVRTLVNGHSIVKYTYKNSVNYFLRLADGGGYGAGNTLTGNVSLKKLKWGQTASLTSVDGTATYNGWQDIVTTMSTIINTERGTDNQFMINSASLDTLAANSTDHSDHIYSSLAVQEAVSNMPWVGINEYIDYASPSYPANLTLEQHAAATAIFAVNGWGLLSSKYAAPFDEGHKGWLPMDVLIIKRLPTGNAPGTVAPLSANRSTASDTGSQLPSGVMLYEDYIKQK
jgi:hypothetical protein